MEYRNRQYINEGSRPFGIHRPVSFYRTGKVRILPFGVWILPEKVREGHPVLRIRTELENLGTEETTVRLSSTVCAPDGEVLEELADMVVLRAGEKKILEQYSGEIAVPQLWSLEKPRLYQLRTELLYQGAVSDSVANTFGLRYIEWENFEGSEELEIDRTKLMEKPSAENLFLISIQRAMSVRRWEFFRGASKSAFRSMLRKERSFVWKPLSETERGLSAAWR